MEESQGEVDALNTKVSIALCIFAFKGHVFEGEFR